MQHSRLTEASSLKQTFIFALLLMTCVLLGLGSMALQAYDALGDETRLRLATEIRYFEQSPHTASIGGSDSPWLFSPPSPLPDNLHQRLKRETVWIPKQTAQQLGWQQFGIDENIIVARVANKGNNGTVSPMLLGLTVPKSTIIKPFIRTALYLLLAIFAIMLWFGLTLSAKTARRLRYIDKTATEIIQQGRLDKRIPINPSIADDEYSRLSATLNTMLDKISALMQELRQVNNNIAHDLKSPLNRLRTRLEVTLLQPRSDEAYQQVLAQSIEDVDTLLKTFQALLLMGNLDANTRDYQLKPISLSELLHTVGDLYTVAAEEKNHRFETDIASGLTVFANNNLLAQAVGNLLDNAMKYTPTNGHIQLSLQRQAATALLVIQDNGPGIPTEQREWVFKRFTRLDESRQLPGTGLGMSLVRSILDAHHATIQLHDNHPGLRVEIRLRCQD